MTPRIGDHALIGDNHTAALVALDGSITWLCLPRFDSPAVFASLLGDEDNGHWTIAPQDEAETSRRYLPGTLVLETTMRTATGTVRVTDFMPHRHGTPTVVRLVEGVDGAVPMRVSLCMRFDYGQSVPWVRENAEGLVAVVGPHTIAVRSPIPLRGDNHTRAADMVVGVGERLAFVLSWSERGGDPVDPGPADQLLAATVSQWESWSDRLPVQGAWADAVSRSLITLKALTYEPSGALVAAPTTSLPEQLGGARNWDYRYTWLRDASFTLEALTANGCVAEAVAWRDWLLRAVAGDPAQLQIVYGIDGERWLPELTVPWLPGHRGSAPVRIGNGAAGQLQLDVYGEVMSAMHAARQAGMAPDGDAWTLQQELVAHVAAHWREPDEGIWEVRGGRRHFVHSKVMAWVALDRAARAVAEHGLPGDAQRYRALADEVHEDVCRQGYDEALGTFVQSYGSTALDASLLLLPAVGFLPATDPRVVRTVDAIAEGLTVDGFVQRYSVPDDGLAADGLVGAEGSFLLCTFWLVDALALRGDRERATVLFERVVAVANDVGLLAEEYDPVSGEMLGNFPQAFSHIGLVNSARLLNDTAAVSSARNAPLG
ncbi:glycoside hydrolase family 15 protein [Demequina sp.]|uniref:glycoside hydrolase family 15 protein n=1 Tax=Demequina sp. TaxID=2050685 RepID=UPI0025C1B3C0|nr:glycoside hydrolase family 15 protein [Demequina sp.]